MNNDIKSAIFERYCSFNNNIANSNRPSLNNIPNASLVHGITNINQSEMIHDAASNMLNRRTDQQQFQGQISETSNSSNNNNNENSNNNNQNNQNDNKDNNDCKECESHQNHNRICNHNHNHNENCNHNNNEMEMIQEIL